MLACQTVGILHPVCIQTKAKVVVKFQTSGMNADQEYIGDRNMNDNYSAFKEDTSDLEHTKGIIVMISDTSEEEYSADR
jgi:hypothetical protein